MPLTLLGQTAKPTISGKVTSISGQPLAGITVSIRSTDTGLALATTTNKHGQYSAELPAGNYEIIAFGTGFADTRITVRISTISHSLPIILLRAGQSKQAAASHTGSPTITSTVNSRNIRELPLNGRSASDLVALEPGITTARTQSLGEGRGFGTQMTISGGRPRQNDSQLDGIGVNDYSNGPPGSALGVNLGADAVEQFSVLTSNYPAKVGRSSGGVIAASTRTGTNEFHGDLYEFLRNSSLDARNFFDTTKPPFRRNQFGASAGGPVQKDRTFIFGDYEGLRQSLGSTQVDTVPSAAARAGKLSTGLIVVDPAILRFLNSFFPLPNGPLLSSGDTGVFTFFGQQVTPENYFTTRVDHHFSTKDTLYGTYMFDSATVTQPDELNNKLIGYDSRSQVLTLHENMGMSSQLLNSFRFGIDRVVNKFGLTFPTSNSLIADPSYGTVPGESAAALSVPGLTSFSGGLGALGLFDCYWTSLQAYDDVTLNKRTHTLTFGIGGELIRDNFLATTNPTGSFAFNSLPDFLTNHPFSLLTAVSGAISPRQLRQAIVGSYVQDDWRWSRHLTIDLGLRYEMATVPSEVENKLTALRHITDAVPHLGSPLFSNPTFRNFEPRVGFSWDPFGRGKTSVSSGFGLFDVLPLPYLIQMNELFSAPFFDFGSVTGLPAGSYPTEAFGIAAASPNTFRQAYFDPYPKRNYVMQWNLTTQHELTKELRLKLSYVGSRGIHQPFRSEDTDIVLPTLTPAGYLWPSPVGSGTRINLNSGRIAALLWKGDSYYDALQLQIKKAFGNSQIGGSYTWGKAIDTSSGSMVGDEYSNSISSPLWFNTRLNRGLSDFDIAQDVKINYTWSLPLPKVASTIESWASNGWELGGVFESSTGVPFTAGIAGDALGVKSTDPAIDVPNLVLGSDCKSLVHPGDPLHYINVNCFAVPTPITLRGDLGRNTLIGPGLLSFDFSVLKNNYIKKFPGSFNVQFRGEFFNVLNRSNFAPPLSNRNVFDALGNPIANAGLITATQTPAREIQFALKLVW